MPTQEIDSQAGLGAAVKDVSERASALVRLELELAPLELKQKLGALRAGVGLGVGAALVALYGLGFALATAAAGLATTLSWWLALLIVTGVLFLLAGLLGLLAMSAIKRGTPPMPVQAIQEAKVTTEALKGDG